MRQGKEVKVVEDTHQLLLWIIPLLDKFPRARRFTLGERIESGLLEVLELLTDAAYRKEKRTILSAANRKLSSVRHLWRLCFELQIISTKRYEHGARLIEDIGSQVGGWIKKLGLNR